MTLYAQLALYSDNDVRRSRIGMQKVIYCKVTASEENVKIASRQQHGSDHSVSLFLIHNLSRAGKKERLEY